MGRSNHRSNAGIYFVRRHGVCSVRRVNGLTTLQPSRQPLSSNGILGNDEPRGDFRKAGAHILFSAVPICEVA
jgi:hypothetical protein